MKFLAGVAGIALAVGLATSAHADGIIYNTLDTSAGSVASSYGPVSDAATYGQTGGSGPLADSFSVASDIAAGTGLTVTLALSVGANDGNSAELSLWSGDANGPDGTQIVDVGKILDNDLASGSPSASLINYVTNVFTLNSPLTAGTYWFVLTDNGTTIATSTSINWLTTADSNMADFVGASGQYNYAAETAPQSVSNSVQTPYQLEISVPEPATLAIFGTALLGFSAIRRRRN